MSNLEIKYGCAKLGNGLRIVVGQRPWSRTFAALLRIEVGTRDDPPGLAGTAHLLEHLQFSGANGSLQEELGRQGVSVNGSTGWEYTTFSASGHVELLPRSLELLRQMLAPKQFELREVHEQLRIIEHELAVDLSSTSNQELRLRQLIGQVIGDPRYGQLQMYYDLDRLRRWELHQLSKHHASWYSPANATLFIVSEHDPTRVARLVARLFGRLRNAGGSLVRRGYETRPPRPLTVLRAPGSHVVVLLCYAIQYGEPVPPPVVVALGNYISGGPYSLVFNLIRKQRQWAYHVSGGSQWIGPTVILQLNMVVGHELVYKALELVVTTIEDLRSRGLCEEEFEMVRQREIRKLDLIEDEPVALCTFLCEAVPLPRSGQIATPTAYRSLLHTLTRRDVNMCTHEVLDPRRRTAVLIGKVGTQTSVLAERLLAR